jgi:hypothetical protein
VGGRALPLVFVFPLFLANLLILRKLNYLNNFAF